MDCLGHKSDSSLQKKCDPSPRASAASYRNSAASVVNCLPESSSQRLKAGNLARRRYQRGSVFLRGKRVRVWIGRWLEDELQPDGSIQRIHKSEVMGSLKDYPTKRLAQRQLDARVSVVNSPTYRARPTATFHELSERWKTLVMSNHEESTQRSEKSDLRVWDAVLGDVQVKDINCELLQQIISEDWKGKRSGKTIRNLVGTFRHAWDKAKVWGYDTITDRLPRAFAFPILRYDLLQ